MTAPELRRDLSRAQGRQRAAAAEVTRINRLLEAAILAETGLDGHVVEYTSVTPWRTKQVRMVVDGISGFGLESLTGLILTKTKRIGELRGHCCIAEARDMGMHP